MYKLNYSGKSIKELKDEFGVGSSGFYKQDWYESESFYTEKPEKGIYEINLGENLKNLMYKEQVEKMEKGFEPVHPAILLEFVLTHFRDKKERLLESSWTRTSSVVSGGYRVLVGHFGSDGLRVRYDWGDDRSGYIGCASARKSDANLEDGGVDTIESRLLNLEKRVSKLEKKKK